MPPSAWRAQGPEESGTARRASFAGVPSRRSHARHGSTHWWKDALPYPWPPSSEAQLAVPVRLRCQRAGRQKSGTTRRLRRQRHTRKSRQPAHVGASRAMSRWQRGSTARSAPCLSCVHTVRGRTRVIDDVAVNGITPGPNSGSPPRSLGAVPYLCLSQSSFDSLIRLRAMCAFIPSKLRFAPSSIPGSKPVSFSVIS